MSKTFENNAQKALTMASGIKQHLSEVAHLGIKTEGLDKLEAEANKAIEMIKEVDALRQEASEKLQKANEQLADVKELAMGYRQTIKNNFPMVIEVDERQLFAYRTTCFSIQSKAVMPVSCLSIVERYLLVTQSLSA